MIATPSKKRDHELLSEYSENINDQDFKGTPIFLQQQAMEYANSIAEEAEYCSKSHANQSEVGVSKSP